MFRAWLASGLGSSARFLSDHAPRVARALRPIWHALNRRFDLSTYWIERRHFEYYKGVARLARVHVPTGGSVLDVGAANTDLLRWLDWFECRVALDRRPAPPSQGIERVVVDFMEYQPPSRFTWCCACRS